MTSVLTPVLPDNAPHKQVHGADAIECPALDKQDTREYLADMLKELSAIAAWAELNSAQQYIDAALPEVETQEELGS